MFAIVILNLFEEFNSFIDLTSGCLACDQRNKNNKNRRCKEMVVVFMSSSICFASSNFPTRPHDIMIMVYVLARCLMPKGLHQNCNFNSAKALFVVMANRKTQNPHFNIGKHSLSLSRVELVLITLSGLNIHYSMYI